MATIYINHHPVLKGDIKGLVEWVVSAKQQDLVTGIDGTGKDIAYAQRCLRKVFSEQKGSKACLATQIK